jgi:PERQ amino acid-rich with GYF domain-containing protein
MLRSQVGHQRAGRADSSESRTAAPWRQTRTTSGSFEGVLGFGSAPGQPPQPPVEEAAPQTAPVGGWRDRFEPPREAEEESWGARAWKVEGVQEDKVGLAQTKPRCSLTLQTLNIPASSLEISSDSIRATPSATPIPERDAAVETAAPSVAESEVISRQSSGPGQPREDLGAVQWFYRDPNSVEQGPFSGTTMHDWYSHSYFDDALPVRRASESSFHSLAELKAATGNAVQPFLSPLRPRALPPNLPIPAAFSSPNGHVAEALKNLNVSPAPGDQRVSPAPQYATYNAFSPNQFTPQPFVSPGFAQPQPWGMGAIGSPMGQPGFGFAARGPMMPNQPYSPVIGPPAPRDPFGPYGAPAAPWQTQTQTQQNVPVHPPSDQAWQAPGPQPPLEMLQQAPVPMQPVQPQVQPEQHVVEEIAQELEPEPAPVEEAAEPESAVISEPEPGPEAEEVPVSEPEPETKAVPPPSVWGQKTTKTSAPSSRKNSILSPAPIAAQLPQTPSASKLPPAPASLPAKPLSARSGSVSESLPPKPVATPPAEKTPVSSKPAPWAVKDDTPRAVPTGPSLREIQEAEARQAEARKAALAEARAATSSPAPVALDDVPTSLSWGLPSSGSGKATTPVPTTTTPPAPAWGNGDAGPKKTLKQIQEEEEKRKAKVAQQANQVRAAVAPTTASKRGYADLAANVSNFSWLLLGSH